LKIEHESSLSKVAGVSSSEEAAEIGELNEEIQYLEKELE